MIADKLSHFLIIETPITVTKKIKLELTEAQFDAFIDVTDMIEIMRGGGDLEWEDRAKNDVRLIDRMLHKNGYRRRNELSFQPFKK